MKKYLLGALLALTTCLTFGNLTPGWDKPLAYETRMFSPIINSFAACKTPSGTLEIQFAINPVIPDGEHWKATVTVRTSVNMIPGGRQWTYMYYTIYVNPGDYYGYKIVSVPGSYQYVYDFTDGFGNQWLADDQFSITWEQV